MCILKSNENIEAIVLKYTLLNTKHFSSVINKHIDRICTDVCIFLYINVHMFIFLSSNTSMTSVLCCNMSKFLQYNIK